MNELEVNPVTLALIGLFGAITAVATYIAYRLAEGLAPSEAKIRLPPPPSPFRK